MTCDQIGSGIAAAARSGYVATNWSAGSPRWNLGAAAANARAPNATSVYAMMGVGAALVKMKVTPLSDSALPLAGAIARTLAGARDVKDALIPGGYPIPSQENLTLHLDNGNNNETDGAVVMTCDGKGRKPAGSYRKIRPVRAYSATTLTQYAYTPCTMTIDGTLRPNMVYDLLGMAAWSAGAVGARINPTNGESQYPGVVAGPTALTATVQMFPEVHRFYGSSPPAVDFLALSADTAEECVWILGEVGETSGTQAQQQYQQQ